MTYIGCYSELGIHLAAGGDMATAATARLRAAILECEGRVDVIAEALGLHRTTIMKLIQRAGLAQLAADTRQEHGVPGAKSPLGRAHERPAVATNPRRVFRP